MANIALYPGGYKPPHIGHYKAAKQALKKGADKVIVFVGPKEEKVSLKICLLLYGNYIPKMTLLKLDLQEFLP